MSCFIDNPNVTERYRDRLLETLPDIKKSKYCAQCLAEHEEEVEPADCPLYQNTVLLDDNVGRPR